VTVYLFLVDRVYELHISLTSGEEVDAKTSRASVSVLETSKESGRGVPRVYTSLETSLSHCETVLAMMHILPALQERAGPCQLGAGDGEMRTDLVRDTDGSAIAQRSGHFYGR
jgi:hypothetical protein